MPKLKSILSTQSAATEVQGMLKDAARSFPGIYELMQVYGEYQEMVRAVEEYLQVTSPEPIATTSDRCIAM